MGIERFTKGEMGKAREMVEKYIALKNLSPKNELLKYFVYNGGDKLDSVEPLWMEFFNRFRKGFSSPNREEMPGFEYDKKHVLFILNKYTSALEAEILKIDKEIIKSWGGE